MSLALRRSSAARLLLAVVLAITACAGALSAQEPAAAVTLSGISGTVIAPDGLNLRTGASTRYRVLANLPYGTELAIIGTSSDWFKVKAGGKTGYVNSWYVALTGSPSKAILRGNTSRKMMALTFDAGADLGRTEQILSILDEYDVTASFGLTGTWLMRYPDDGARIAADGHQILNHTLNHPSYTGYSTGTGALSPAKRLSQLEANESLIRAVTGISSNSSWRPPYGDYDAGVLRDAGAAGWSKTVLWTVDSYGWKGLTSDQIYQRVVDNAGNGVIVLMHVGSDSRDALALERIIQTLRARGYSFGTVAQVIAA